MGLFYRTKSGQNMDFTLELKPDWYSDIRQETRGRFFAPEWFPQSFIELIWPTEETDWNYILPQVTATYVRLTYEIAKRERLLIVTSSIATVKKTLAERLPGKIAENITLLECPINDTWARDSGMLTMITPEGPELLDFGFNGWGGKFAADKDNAINSAIINAHILNGSCRDMKSFVLEGGSVETDGKDTLLTTESCLLSGTRNTGMTKSDIELTLKKTFNSRQVLWLKHGKLEGDDTDGHIDTIARLCPGGKIAYVKCSDASDPQHEELKLMEEELHTFRQLSGEPFTLVPLPMPAPVYAPDNGERLPATYANYLVTDTAVIVPSYGQPKNDKAAADAIASIFTGRETISVDATALIRQHGSIHCCAMQFPAGVAKNKNIKTY